MHFLQSDFFQKRFHEMIDQDEKQFKSIYIFLNQEFTKIPDDK